MRNPGQFAVALLAVLAVLAAAPTPASAESEDAGEPETVTTTLHPGWNMVGWLGPDAPATALFEAIPALRRVSAWDPVNQRYLSRTRTSIPRHALKQLTPGMGLWLRLGGDAPVEWRRPALNRSVLLPLHRGLNLVGWTGRDGTRVDDALTRFRGSLVRAYRWDGEAQAHKYYRPGASPARNTLSALTHGEALWVELTGAARWWQPGHTPVPVEFFGEITGEQQAEIRQWAEGSMAFFAERWGVEAPFSSYVGDLESLGPRFLEVWGFQPETLCAAYASGVIFARIGCVGPGTYPHEYFHALQDSLRENRRVFIPRWLIEGTASWAGVVHSGAFSDEVTVEEEVDRHLTESISALVRHDPPTLRAVVEAADFDALGELGYRMGFVATDWLVNRSSEEAILEFFQTLGGDHTWEEAFELAFGLSTEAFHEAFEAYTSEIAPPLPHFTDDSNDPALVLMGEIPPETQAAIRTSFATMLELYEARLAAGTADYTVYIGANAESLADVYRLTTGNDLVPGFCRASAPGVYLIATIDCIEHSPRILLVQHSESVREHLAPLGALPPLETGHDRKGPHWLLLAIEAHAIYLGESAFGFPRLAEGRAAQVSLARRVAEPLSALAGWDAVLAAGFWEARTLSSLAGELLAERAGDAALFDYFRQLPSTMSWREAFEAAFGISVERFYGEFESYRAEVAPPWPHRIRGVVLDPSGNYSTGAWVAANRGEGRWTDTAITGQDGTFELRVGDGRYYLNVDLTTVGCVVPTDDRLHSGGIVEVDGGDVTDVEIHLPEGSSCAGS